MKPIITAFKYLVIFLAALCVTLVIGAFILDNPHVMTWHTLHRLTCIVFSGLFTILAIVENEQLFRCN
jgi:hypothetical protein